MLNLSPLFFTGDDTEVCLYNELDLEEQQRSFIANAKTDVRNCLRTGIPRVLKSKGYSAESPTPRFFTQGSWAYKTLNAPAKQPQQADIDDGCYLPLSFVSQSTPRPSVAATIFFDVAEEVLAPLAKERGWTLITDKPTCVRIEIAPFAHIDVPLYAIPDKEFETLAKAAMEHGHVTLDEAVRRAERDAWTALPRNSVLLAHREKNWMESDPRPVRDWFLGEVAVRGEQLRRIVRYLKAFRDWRWSSGGPASILLMAAAAPLFEKRDRRDDLALLDVVATLPAKLRGGVANPVADSESLTDRLGKEGVEEAAQAFEELEKMLRGAIHASDGEVACIWMRRQFGPRFPNDPDRVKVTTAAATIAATPAAAGPSELVGRTKAG